jgi:hypothetical protein
MAAELRAEDPASALDAIGDALGTIAAREDGGYVTEAMVEHRLRMLGLSVELGMPSAGTRGLALSSTSCVSGSSEWVVAGPLRVRAELSAHGQSVETVRGHEKPIRASFRVGLAIENTGHERLTLEAPSVDGSPIGMPVTRWYLLGSDGRPWDGVIEGGGSRCVNAIGYLPEPAPPGTRLDATVRLRDGSSHALELHASTFARKHWNLPWSK